MTQSLLPSAALALLLAAVLPTPRAPAQDAPPPSEAPAVGAPSWLRKDGTGRLDVDDADLARLVDEILPVVETVCGRKFLARPEVRLSDINELAASLAADLGPTLRHFYRGTDPRRIDRLLRDRASLMAASMMGKYGMHDDVLYVVPERVEQFLAFFELDLALADEMIQLVVAHELVHALQDQVLDLARKLETTTDQDAIHTVNALIEGHAVHCSEEVARRLGFAEAIEPFRKMVSGELDGAQQGLYLTTRFNRALGETYYLRGADLVAELEREGTGKDTGEEDEDDASGSKSVWQVLAGTDPPSAVVFDPSKLNTARQLVGETEHLLAAVRGWLGRGRWMFGRGTLGTAVLRSMLRSADEEVLDRILGSLRHSVTVEAEGPVPMLRAFAVKLRFDGPEAAADWYFLARTTVAREVGGDLEDFGALQGARATDGELMASALDVGPSVGPAGRIVWACSGDTVVEVSTVGLPRSDAQLAELVQAVLAAPIRPEGR